MKGFITWFRNQPRFADLATDAGPSIGSFRLLVRAMFAHNACDEAWSMLHTAIHDWPGRLPQGWDKTMFEGNVPSYALSGALYAYAAGTQGAATAEADFEKLLEMTRMLWIKTPTNAPEFIEMQLCSPAQICRLWAARKE